VKVRTYDLRSPTEALTTCVLFAAQLHQAAGVGTHDPGPGRHTTQSAGPRRGSLALCAIHRRADRDDAPLRPGLYPGRRGCVAEDGAERCGVHAGEVLNPVTCFES